MRCDVWYYKKHYYFFILFSLTQVQSMLQFPLVARTFFLHLYLFTCPDTASCKQELVIVLQILDVGWIEFRINTNICLQTTVRSLASRCAETVITDVVIYIRKPEPSVTQLCDLCLTVASVHLLHRPCLRRSTAGRITRSAVAYADFERGDGTEVALSTTSEKFPAASKCQPVIFMNCF